MIRQYMEHTPLYEMMNRLSLISDYTWGMYAFSRELLGHRITEEEKRRMIAGSIVCGTQHADRYIKAASEGKDICTEYSPLSYYSCTACRCTNCTSANDAGINSACTDYVSTISAPKISVGTNSVNTNTTDTNRGGTISAGTICASTIAE